MTGYGSHGQHETPVPDPVWRQDFPLTAAGEDDVDMPERTSYEPGTPSWVDLGTSDLDASRAFYGELFGWTADEPGPVEETGGYTMFRKDGKLVAMTVISVGP